MEEITPKNKIKINKIIQDNSNTSQTCTIINAIYNIKKDYDITFIDACTMFCEATNYDIEDLYKNVLKNDKYIIQKIKEDAIKMHYLKNDENHIPLF